MNRTLISVLAAATLSFAVGCGDKDGGDSSDTTTHDHGTTDAGEGDATNGATVYANSCAGCHGTSGEGGSGPSMSSAVAEHSASAIANIAMNGEGSMPPVLSDSGDAADVAAYAVATWGP